jgi:hypothetical protein
MKNGLENNLKEAGGHSPEELKQFREMFAADLEQYRATERRRAIPILVVFLAGFAAVVCSFLFSQHPVKWLLGAGIFLVAAGLVSLATAAVSFQKGLKCPACHNQFIDDIGECCPECGSTPLEPADWLGARHCNACGKNLRIGRNRNFKYKACTHCGVFLDEKGL